MDLEIPQQNETLWDASWYPMAKSLPDGAADASDPGEGPWRFHGIASDVTQDEHGENILRKALDLTYADSRGFVNWDHSTEPEHQIGYLAKAQLVSPREVPKFEKTLGVELSPTASVFVEGFLHKYVPKAESVANLMKSSPPGKGVGLSLQGALARDRNSGDIVRAFVRGVAITPVPAQPKTLAALAKSLRALEDDPMGTLSADVLAAIQAEVSTQTEDLRKTLAGPVPKQLTEDQAVRLVGERHPDWSFSLVKKVVAFAIQQHAPGRS